MANEGLSVFAAAGWGVVGTGLIRSHNIASIARTGVGVYSVTLSNGLSPLADGLVLTSISGAFKISGAFADATHITLTVLNLSGSAADPPNGTLIQMGAWK